MSNDPPFVEPPAPTGYRLYRGANLLAEYSCPMCPERFCLCFSTAWEKAKREALTKGGSYFIETFARVRLAEMRSVDRAGSTKFKRSGPAKPPRRVRAETIPPPPPLVPRVADPDSFRLATQSGGSAIDISSEGVPDEGEEKSA